ncbi:MAG: hypothetical protein EA397_15225 [Deltaproteobacteria bacterium]|nr:MAG: hypothetical protein EA397_15225 [Deltaproteobacteria bacterium]
MSEVLRWGQSAYETSDDLAREREVALSLGLTWRACPDITSLPEGEAEVLVVTSKVTVNAEALDALRPAVIITTTSGYEHLDLRACEARGIQACRCPLARRDAVVEHTLEALIRLLRRLDLQETPAHEGRWARGDLPSIRPRGLRGARIAVVGLGVIGRTVCEYLTSLGAELLPVDPLHPSPPYPVVPLDEAVDQADALTLHASAHPSAVGLLSADRLRSLRSGCVVVNTARGDLMDPITAAELVRAGHLGGLACDVFPIEPWPQLAAQAASNVLLTPHASGYTVGLGARVAAEVHAALGAWVAGEPLPWRLC